MPDVLCEFLPLPSWPGLGHALSTRHGGASAGPYATLNLGYHVGDDPARVSENRRRFAAAAGYDPAALVTAQQVHGTRLAWVGPDDRGRGALDLAGAVPETDGLLVAAPGVPIAIQVADCAPVLIVDPVRRALALVHAGWRGALGRIASAAVRALAAAGSRPDDLWVGIGPSLCPACLEVSPEIGAAVAAALGPAAIDAAGARPHLRLHAMLTADLAGAGVPAARIVAHPHCTRCRVDRFFSHRGQAGCAGRLALAAWWAA